MSKLIDWLERLNSKERYFLVGHALGNKSFQPSNAFRKEIRDAIGIDVPTTAFAAMDYHIDWIYGSLFLSKSTKTTPVVRIKPDCVTASQEDIDFIIAFDRPGGSAIILLEAKGVTGWSNSQMARKAARFKAIFGNGGQAWDAVTPFFALVSPRKPFELQTKGWPAWMSPGGKVPWISLPNTAGHTRIHRCDANGRETRIGQFWTVANR